MPLEMTQKVEETLRPEGQLDLTPMEWSVTLKELITDSQAFSCYLKKHSNMGKASIRGPAESAL